MWRSATANCSRKWTNDGKSRLQSDAESQALPDGEQEALRQVFYGKDSPGNLPAELIRSLYNVPALMQIRPLRGGNHAP